ncbi:MAG: Choline dehydrogenase (EC [uncultured Paraburkholderia sp.]|nr:MAG: Choline dehydrogenase (EC [uncultured Paraburkholderia sp.]CAH2910780.1 MAG: Choline dehydrogenase (EC [uncultured Paraburkholderia sp.]
MLLNDISAHVYDYVIVGAGPAGCIIADHLSHDPSASVLLLEAGGDLSASEDVLTPNRWPALIDSVHDWAHRTEPQSALGNRSVAWPRGRMVGGSAAMHAMAYVRGHPDDFARWEDEIAPSWGWASLQRFFDRLEQGSGEIVSVERPKSLHPFCEAFLDAAQMLGLPCREMVDVCARPGIGRYHVMQRDGLRSFPAQTCLARALSRSNFTMLTHCRVDRLKFDGCDARQVIVKNADGARPIRVDREIVLCAGTIGSPAVLLRSGVGPARMLRAADVPIAHALEGAGANLHDHAQVTLSARSLNSVSVAPTSNLGEVGGFLNTSASIEQSSTQLVFAPIIGLSRSGDIGSGFSLGPSVGLPASRGRVGIRRVAGRLRIDIDPAYLTDERDLAVLRDGVVVCREIIGHPRLSAIAGAAGRDFDGLRGSDAIRRFCRAHAHTQFHPVGTCRAGRGDDAVVAPDFKVIGLNNVRIIDGSVIPSITRANTCAPIMALAMLAADSLAGG